MFTSTEFLVGALVGAVVVLFIAWLFWDRKNRAYLALEDQSRGLVEARSRLEEENKGLTAEAKRLGAEKSAADAALLHAKTEQAALEGTVSRLQIEKATAQSEWERVSFEDQKLREKLAMAEGAWQRGESAMHADLTAISGIDGALAYRLNRAGVWTAEDLGKLSPDRLGPLMGIPADSAPALQTIRSARAAAGLAIDDLEVIDGIGPVIARILYNSCIYTFADLGALEPEQLRAMLGEKVQRLSNEAYLLQQARDLAKPKA